MNTHTTRGIRDTSAQDVALQKNSRAGWLKWGLPGAGVIVLAGLFVSVLSTWLSAEASVASDRIRTALVQRGDLVRDLKNITGTQHDTRYACQYHKQRKIMLNFVFF